jgi:formate C-acetyltransferase
MMHPSSVQGSDGLRAMRALLDVYRKHNGNALQFNIFDKNMLLDAQKHPDKYAELQVRVCGWNGRFNDLPLSEQNAYIERAGKYTE